MKLESHYIFLPKEKKKPYKSEDGVIVIDLPVGVRAYIEKAFSGITSSSDVSIYRRVYDAEFCISDIVFKAVFSLYNAGESTYLDIKVEGKAKVQIIKCLEYIEETLFSSGIEDDYICVISYDAVSEYYCNKIYPKLNTLERKLRRLLYNTYIVNFGLEYYEQTIIKDVKDNAKKRIGKNGNKQEKRNKEFFEYVDFGDIQRVLFTVTWNEYDEKQKQKFLDAHPDLSELSDEVLRDKFSEFSPKSDWKRFFAHKTDDTIMVENTINEIREFRNQVAHCKHFSSDEYKECAAAIKKLSRAIDQAIKITEERDFEQKNREMLQLSIERFKDSMDAFASKIGESFKSLIDLRNPFRLSDPLKEMLDDIKKSVSQIYLSSAATDNQVSFPDETTDDGQT